MSTDEDVELRDLVSQALEMKGILSKIRAELRANVFLALEENNRRNDTVFQNNAIHEFAQTSIGPIVLNLIREFLDYFDLGFTLAVFSPETKCGQDCNEISREKLLKIMGLSDGDTNSPVLCTLVSNLLSGHIPHPINKLGYSNINGNTPSPGGLNATYTKISDNGTPISLFQKKIDEDDEESINEDLASNKSSVSDMADNEHSPVNAAETGPQTTPLMNGTNTHSTTPPPHRNSIDLLTFTPIKEVTTKGKSMLGDLPPLTLKTEAFGSSKDSTSHIHKIKAIYAQDLDMDNFDEGSPTSLQSKNSKEQVDADDYLAQESIKSDQSHKSDKTETVDEELEQDGSENNQTNHSQGSPVTVDETISEAAGVFDHLEVI